ncbi:MAG TPA: exonuclease SbcC [Chlorobaculum parvum]|uniref:Exonuclease SbcC n=1 Tax=Chlorobaculum parvum TaxID=274539 RepID=A0A7C5DDT7_9CHLB|nr:exonuclease SbcC [Chlorobaculum parvum]
MKILTLRFANLNSLQGEWLIDFTRPEYVADGVFAITGPTGSGKSTILDAICLALYGETPRLGKITVSSNEIMSRHAGECFAEVTFAAASGTFRCTWSQHRSRKKPGGVLQAQKHEIADAETGEVIQSKVQETRQEVEVRTGMDFDRFTRSMLLAQGGFAKFLQADADQRAPVLEQITGTEIYSVISMKVHERKRTELEQLQRFELEAGGLRLLTPEVLVELEAERGGLVETERELSKNLESDAAALRWLDEIARLEEALAATGHEAETLEAEREAFRDDARRLERARTAELVEAVWTEVRLMREEVRRNAADLAGKEAQHPEAERAVHEANEAHKAAERNVASAQQAVQDSRPLIARARRLDEQIVAKSGELARLKQERKTLERRQAQFRSERTEVATVLESTRRALQELREWQAEHRIDASLAGALSGIRHALEELHPAAQREAVAASAIDGLHRDQETLQDELALAEADACESRSAFEEADKALGELKGAFLSQLDGATLKSLLGELDLLRERHRLLEAIMELYAEGKQFAPKIERIDTEIQGAERRRTETSLKLDHARQLLESVEREVVSQEELARLADRVRSLEEERGRLVEAEPCPLCGSTHHPYAEGALPESGGDALQAARLNVRERSAEVNGLEIAFAKSGTEIEERRKSRQELADLRESSGRKCLVLLKEAGIDAPPREAELVVSEALRQTASQRDALAGRIGQLEMLEQRIRDDEADLSQRKETVLGSQRNFEQATERQRSMRLDLARLEKELEQAQQNLAGRRRSFADLIEPFGIRELDDPSTIAAALEERSEAWLGSEARVRSLEQEQLSSESRLKNLDEQLFIIDADCSAKRRDAEAAEAGLKALQSERAGVLQGGNPDAEEVQLEKSLQATREKLDEVTEIRNAAREALSVLDTAMSELRRAVEERREKLDRREEAFGGELRQRGFDGEAAFLEARLEDDERQRLEELADSLDRRTRDLQARRQERQARLQETRERQLSTETVEELSARIAKRQEQLRDVRGRIGAIANQLRENAQAADEHRSKMQAVESQKSECRRWEFLHDLIGSADGKKFRNFAQGITFELMIQNANIQLKQMIDRYQLLHDPSAPLELSVIDQWQAGEIRSTRNLSGGESFIVSLALALGLSQMSSRNVRVDSLFLDEGFGTLDEEALETALETLAGLQQSGKLIGVISHVAALRDRISSHIRVTPLSGGRSAIEGPGVSNASAIRT